MQAGDGTGIPMYHEKKEKEKKKKKKGKKKRKSDEVVSRVGEKRDYTALKFCRSGAEVLK